MMRIPVSGIGVRAPNLASWSELVLRPDYQRPTGLDNSTPKGVGAGLPPAEKRRSTPVTRLALDVAMEAAGSHPLDELTTVITSSGGEVTVVHEIFGALASDDKALSPTTFHNSVHNTAAGYWSIASGSQYAADSLCALNDSFGAGMAECALRYQDGERNLLLIHCEYPPPFPIIQHRPLHQALGVALLLGAETQTPLAFLEINYRAKSLNQTDSDQRTGKADDVERCYRSLDLIQAISRKEVHQMSLSAGFGGCLDIEIRPCA